MDNSWLNTTGSGGTRASAREMKHIFAAASWPGVGSTVHSDTPSAITCRQEHTLAYMNHSNDINHSCSHNEWHTLGLILSAWMTGDFAPVVAATEGDVSTAPLCVVNQTAFGQYSKLLMKKGLVVPSTNDGKLPPPFFVRSCSSAI